MKQKMLLVEYFDMLSYYVFTVGTRRAVSGDEDLEKSTNGWFKLSCVCFNLMKMYVSL